MRLKPTHTYEVIAGALRASRPRALAPLLPGMPQPMTDALEHGDATARGQWEHDVRAMAHALRADNRSFRLDLFFEQCGLNDE